MVYIIGENGPQSSADASPAIDVGIENFMEQVVEKSKLIPVLVDFWAPWCGPCKSLTPILEELAVKYADAFQLVKVNIDEAQELAAQFQVRSVPTVFLVHDGQVVNGFQGAQPKNVIEEFLSKHIQMGNRVADDPVEALLNQGRVSEAIKILAKDDTDETRIRIAAIYLRTQQFEAAREAISKVKDATNNTDYKSICAALDFIEFVEGCESEEELQVQIRQTDQNWEAHYRLAAIHLVRGDPEFALNTLLEIVKHDRTYNDDAGRKGMVKAFDMLGYNHELVPKYRSKLAAILN